MSAGANVWPLIRELAAELDVSREHSERTLDLLEKELRYLTREGRDDVRRQVVLIVASLARLEMRLVASDGPLQSAV
jgi:hypothetical protein